MLESQSCPELKGASYQKYMMGILTGPCCGIALLQNGASFSPVEATANYLLEKTGLEFVF